MSNELFIGCAGLAGIVGLFFLLRQRAEFRNSQAAYHVLVETVIAFIFIASFFYFFKRFTPVQAILVWIAYLIVLSMVGYFLNKGRNSK